MNRKCLENIAYAGGIRFDQRIPAAASSSRADQRDTNGVTFIEQLMRYGQRYQTEQNNAQQSLFGGEPDIVDIQRRR